MGAKALIVSALKASGGTLERATLERTVTQALVAQGKSEKKAKKAFAAKLALPRFQQVGSAIALTTKSKSKKSPVVAGTDESDNRTITADLAHEVLGNPDLCTMILLHYSSNFHVHVARLVLATSAVCMAWRHAVNSAKVWRALCHQRWPSTSELPLPPLVDYCRYFKSRAVAQLELQPLKEKDVFFLLEIHGARGEIIISKALCLGDARSDTRGPGYCWHLPCLKGVLAEKGWRSDGTGFYRRSDGRVHHVDVELRQSASFRFPGGDAGGGGGDGAGSDDESDDVSMSSGEKDGFIVDDDHDTWSLQGSEEEEEEEEEGESSSSEHETRPRKNRRVIDDDDDDDDDSDDDEEKEEVVVGARKHRRVIADDDEEDEEEEPAKAAGGKSRKRRLPQFDGVGDDDDDDDDDLFGDNDTCDGDHDEMRSPPTKNRLRDDAVSLDNVVAYAQFEGMAADEDDDSEVRIVDDARIVLAFDYTLKAPGSIERTPMLILQFQSRSEGDDEDEQDGWQPEDSWVGDQGRTKGIWQILDSVRWG